jgi:hypothetical protein
MSFLLPEEGKLLIVQLQGRKHTQVSDSTTSPHLLGELSESWKNVLISGAHAVAKSLRVDQLGIQSAQNNPWTKILYSEWSTEALRGKPHLPLDTAQEVYDKTADKLGFSIQGNDKKFWKHL